MDLEVEGCLLGVTIHVEVEFGLDVDDFGLDFVHGEPEVGEGFFFDDAFAFVADVGDGFEGDLPRSHEPIAINQPGGTQEAADGFDAVFFEVEGDRGVEAVDEVGGVEVVGIDAEGAFFEALLGGEEFAGSAGGVEEFVGFGEVADVKAADGEGKLTGFIEGEFAGAEGVPGEDVPLGEGVESGGFGVDEFAEAVVGDRFAGFGEGDFGAHFCRCCRGRAKRG